MKSHWLLAAVTAVRSAAAPPAVSASDDWEFRKCTDTIVHGRPETVWVVGHKFRCPGRVNVADEKEIKQLPNFSAANAYFKGALIHVWSYRPNDTVTYVIVVENWADARNCRIAPPLVRFRTGGFVRTWLSVKDGIAKAVDTVQPFFEKDMRASWELTAKSRRERAGQEMGANLRIFAMQG